MTFLFFKICFIFFLFSSTYCLLFFSYFFSIPHLLFLCRMDISFFILQCILSSIEEASSLPLPKRSTWVFFEKKGFVFAFQDPKSFLSSHSTSLKANLKTRWQKRQNFQTHSKKTVFFEIKKFKYENILEVFSMSFLPLRCLLPKKPKKETFFSKE